MLKEYKQRQVVWWKYKTVQKTCDQGEVSKNINGEINSGPRQESYKIKSRVFLKQLREFVSWKKIKNIEERVKKN